MLVNLSNDGDKFVWKLTTFGTFIVKSMYADFMNVHTVYLEKYIWKLKVPLKIKIFMWFLHRKVILTLKKYQNIIRVVHFTSNISPPTK
jgi:hypothetical protein